MESEIESVERADSRLEPIRTEIEAIEDEIGDDERAVDGDGSDAAGDGSDAAGDGSDAAAIGFGALDACRTRTAALREDCDRIAARRQRVLADHERQLSLGDEIDLPGYCYQDLDVTYPVLAAVGAVGDRLEGLKGTIEKAMARSH